MIDIGAEAINRGAAWLSKYTAIGKDNPANASGPITTVEIWADSDLVNCVVGTFYTTNGNTLKCRDSVAIGSVAKGSKQTFNGLSLMVETGDYIGMYYTAGSIDLNTSGYAGLWAKYGEYMDPDDEAEYYFYAGDAISLHGTGEEVTPPPVRKRGWWSK